MTGSRPRKPVYVTWNSTAMARAFATREAGLEWDPRDLGAMLQHQLRAELRYDLGADPVLGPVLQAELARTPEIVTFQDLLTHPRPPVRLLEAVKVFAKSAAQNPDRPLPAPIGTVLYYLAIAVALQRCGKRITALSDGDLEAGVEWVLGQAWVGEGPRKTLAEMTLGTRC